MVDNVLPFDAATVAKNAATRANTKPEKHMPLHREMPPALEYPAEYLGAMRQSVEAFAAISEAPIAMVAQSVIAAATLVTSPCWDVHLPRGIGNRPLTLFLGSMAVSGERKSHLDSMVIKPITDKEAIWNENHAEAVNSAKRRIEVWNFKCKSARKAANESGDHEAYQKTLKEIGPKPQLPVMPMLLVDNTTIEGLVEHLALRPYGGVFSTEVGTLLGGYAFRDERKMATAATLNKLYSGEPIRLIRKTSESRFLNGLRVSAHFMMQPNIMAKLIHDAELRNVGLLSRFLLVDPPSTMGTRLQRVPPRWAEDIRDSYYGRMNDLLRRVPTEYGPNGLEPRPIELTPEAEEQFHDLCESIEKYYLAPDPTEAISPDFASRAAEHAGRLAGVMAAYQSDEPCIDSDTMKDACYLATHYLIESDRLREGVIDDPVLELAGRVLKFLQEHDEKRIHLATIYQRGPRGVRTADKAMQIMTRLERHGWVERLPSDTMLDGIPHQFVWQFIE